MKTPKQIGQDVRHALWLVGLHSPESVGIIAAAIAAERAEVERLKRGEFTREEFQALCHHRDERPGCTAADFAAGCREYQAKLFGQTAPLPPPTPEPVSENIRYLAAIDADWKWNASESDLWEAVDRAGKLARALLAGPTPEVVEAAARAVRDVEKMFKPAKSVEDMKRQWCDVAAAAIGVYIREQGGT